MKKIICLFLMLPFLGWSQVQIGQDIHGEGNGDESGWVISLSSDGSIVAIGAHLNNGNGNNSGHVRVFENINETWTQIGQDINGEQAEDRSGSSLSLSSNGNILAIGAPRNGSNSELSGHVRVFENINGTWTQIGQDLDGESSGDQFGWSVSLSDNGAILAIGAIESNTSNKGYVKVFENINGTWTQIGQKIIGENIGGSDFGWSVNISNNGNRLAVGDPFNNPTNDFNGAQTGHVRIFENINDAWTQIGQDIDGESSGDQSGNKISLSSDGSTIAIGAVLNSGNGQYSGHVRVFEDINGIWTQIGQDIDGESQNDFFGFDVNLSSDASVIFIGATGTSNGTVRLYKNINNSWTKIGQDLNGDSSGNQFGFSIDCSIDAGIIAIGDRSDNGNGSERGQVKVYDISSELALYEVIEDIAGNINGINVTAAQLNSIIDVSGAIEGVDYTIALQNGSYVDPSSPTASEIQAIIDQVNSTLSITEESSLDYQLYPNPTKSQFTVQLNDGNSLEQIEVYTILGELLITSKQTTVNTSNLSTGTYLVKITTAQGTATEKLIIE
ncbi:T9SS type A sorting domain-containing protein [Ichthyenterobacterium sp. W332]|uniref:T9SS type A sorting domain-containing protein n=1 Tax=Microcosmobacter mediterraneus TaxID=3075607 RepID=A0ABU2YJZ8_9FLAO|nr:T9SS type A sorting domain-containing protein [Ichthyenterobacterium sp. W332]MDT0558014.1 T9SS type A sorting domain-containing protein [Ichthyenterobacterium sp. W332]